MMKSISVTIIIFIFISGLWAKEFSSWISQSPQDQITVESEDDQLGYGRVFVPVMTVSEWEPRLKIFNNDDKTLIGEYKPGRSIFLKPGKYTMMYGSSDDPMDFIQKPFSIFEHQTKIIVPDWSGLIVSVINENMEFVRYGYEILHMETGISAGIKYSKEESSFNDINSTWILPPGKYKIVKQGEPFNTITNFSTFELKTGELTEMTVVINDVQQFVGAGELGILENFSENRKDWYNILNLKGSIIIYSHNKDNEDENTTDIISRGKIDSRFIYDSKPYYLNFRQILNEEWTKTEALEGFRASLDELDFKNTAIYYFTDVFGLYGEINLGSKIFPDNYYDINAPVLKIDRNGNGQFMDELKNFKLSDSFTPIHTEESLGLNFTFIKSSSSNLYLRTGFGFLQTFNDNVYSLTSSTDSLYTFTEYDDDYQRGLVFTAGADFNFTNSITYNSTANLFYNLDKDSGYNLKWENDLIFKIFKYVSLDYNFNLNYDYLKNSSNYIVYDHRIALEFSYYINR